MTGLNFFVNYGKRPMFEQILIGAGLVLALILIIAIPVSISCVRKNSRKNEDKKIEKEFDNLEIIPNTDFDKPVQVNQQPAEVVPKYQDKQELTSSKKLN